MLATRMRCAVWRCMQAEFDAEQEYIKTLSYLTPEDQQKHLDRQGVSFMYQKPPGYDAAMAKASSAQARAHGCKHDRKYQDILLIW